MKKFHCQIQPRRCAFTNAAAREPPSTMTDGRSSQSAIITCTDTHDFTHIHTHTCVCARCTPEICTPRCFVVGPPSQFHIRESTRCIIRVRRWRRVGESVRCGAAATAAALTRHGGINRTCRSERAVRKERHGRTTDTYLQPTTTTVRCAALVGALFHSSPRSLRAARALFHEKEREGERERREDNRGQRGREE